jgi:MFS family permease
MNIIYESMGIKKQDQKIPLNGGQTLLSLIVSVGCAFLIDRVGQRPLFLSATTGMCCMFLAWTITAAVYENSHETKLKSAGYPQVVWVWLFSVFYSLAWSGLLVAYALKILPYKLRAKGLMIMNLTVQASLVLGNYTNTIAWANLPHHWNFELFYTVSFCRFMRLSQSLTYSVDLDLPRTPLCILLLRRDPWSNSRGIGKDIRWRGRRGFTH